MQESINFSIYFLREEKMKCLSKTLIYFGILIFFIQALGAPIEKTNIEGNWIGGFKIEDKWILVNAHFKIEEGIIKANIDLPFEKEPRLAPTKVDVNRCHVKFMVLNGTEILLFDGECNGVTISGYVKKGLKKGAFHLFRIPKIESDLAPGEMGSSQP